MTETTVQAAEVAAIRFGVDNEDVAPSIPLVAGGYVELVYDADRFYALVDREAEGGFFAEHHHCYGQGCCDVSFSDVLVHYRFDDTGTFASAPMGVHESFALELPPSAERLEVYFSVPGFDMRTWYCGSDERVAEENRERAASHWIEHQVWDSLWGRNYIFDIVNADAPLPIVQRLADGQWADGYSPVTEARLAPAWDAHIWVDFSLAPQGQSRRAGIRWSVDRWNNWEDADAVLKRTTDAGREVWGAEVRVAHMRPPALGLNTQAPSIEYAIYYEVDGHTYWDNNRSRNYEIVLNTDYEE